MKVGMTQHDVADMIEAAHRKLGFEGGADVQVGEYSSFPHGSIKPQQIRQGTIGSSGASRRDRTGRGRCRGRRGGLAAGRLLWERRAGRSGGKGARASSVPPVLDFCKGGCPKTKTPRPRRGVSLFLELVAYFVVVRSVER